MESNCPSQKAAFEELERVAPGAPFLALGQTVFWDEPVKAGVALISRSLGYDREFVAGVHDADYFAKLHRPKLEPGYRAFPHNDTTTQGFWSAAGEFSHLFGSETVVTREALHQAGLRLSKVEAGRPELLDEGTAAFGWRGLAAVGRDTDVVAETQLAPMFDALRKTLEWAIQHTLECLSDQDAERAIACADRLRAWVCDLSEPRGELSLSDFYQRLLLPLYSLAAGEKIELSATSTMKLLRFNRGTASLPRFSILEMFLRPSTSEGAKRAYNEVVRGTEVYTLDRFGSLALPFDLVVPGVGRGTIRVAPRSVVVMTPKPIFVPLKKPVESVQDLADAIESRLGPNCALVGKAITLIGMLSREFVFVFHEGASAYVSHSKRLHNALAQMGDPGGWHPILRVHLKSWKAIGKSGSTLVLPEELVQPFGCNQITASDFARRYPQVIEEQTALLAEIRTIRRPLDLVRFLARSGFPDWQAKSEEYQALHDTMDRLHRSIDEVKQRRRAVVEEIKEARRTRVALEREKGDHFRAEIFEREPTAEALERREGFERKIAEAMLEVRRARREWHELQLEQEAIVASREVQNAHTRRREIEFEAELKRLKLVRQAIIAVQGLERSGRRPSSWWFPMVSPDGAWFRETVCSARYYLEPLS